jgi:SAM-dependent methyltransferase
MDINESKEKHRNFEAAMGYWKGAFDENEEDTKRHFEMLNTALPIVHNLNIKTLLSIGDNRGRDAAFFKLKLGCHVTASDLDISKLIPAKLDGFIDECRIEDVEKLNYEDNSIDIVLIKESFHHWPRPMLGVYECLRVAKYGVILIEPYDCNHANLQKPYIDSADFSDAYEEVGNYKYQISLREITKAAWSLYLNRVFALGFNDPYMTPFKYQEWLPAKNKLDELGNLGKRQFNLMTIFIEKERGCLNLIEDSKYKIYTRPINSFIGE